MHRIVRLLVKANNEKEANNKAEEALNTIIEQSNGSNDSFAIFNTSSDSGTYGSGRWGDQKSPIKVGESSYDYYHKLRDGIDFTRKDFIGRLDELRIILNTKTYENILNSVGENNNSIWDNPIDVYSLIYDVSNTRFFSYYVDDEDEIEPLISLKALKRILKENVNNTMYVVLADMHS